MYCLQIGRRNPRDMLCCQKVRKYLKFIRAKRDIALQSMDGEFNDVYNDRCEWQAWETAVVMVLKGL